LAFGSPDKDAGKPAPAGLRMSGEYGSQAGLDLEFRPEGVVVGCRDAAVLRPYVVQVQGAQLVVGVQNGSSAFTMTLGVDGRLIGSGTIQVDGRVVTGSNGGGDITYAPRSANCSLGSIGPATGGSAQVAPVGGNEAPAPIGPGSTGASGPTGTGNAILAVAIGIPAPAGAVNPFTGQSIVLLNASLESILTTAGIRAAPGTSMLKAMGIACQNQAPECRQAVLAIGTHGVGAVKTDLAGKAQFPGVAPGTYYLFGSAASNKGPLVWSLRVELKAGNNSLILDERNAQIQN
jgi:hypothetical protein